MTAPRAPRRAIVAIALTLTAAFLAGACGEAPTAVPPPRDGLVEATLGLHPPSRDGANAWARHCQICHGPSGAGDGFNAKLLPTPPPTAAALATRFPGDALATAIARGSAAGGLGPSCPAWRLVLGPAGLTAVAEHVRALAINPVPPGSPR